MSKFITRKTILPLFVGIAACTQQDEPAEQPITSPPAYTLSNAVSIPIDASYPPITAISGSELGIDFVHETGAAGAKMMPETMGPGCALYDHDGDGRLDALFIDGRPWNNDSPHPLGRLYHNEGERFREITAESGLDKVTDYGMGVAIADYDADGDPDLAVTTVNGVHLLRNDDGRYSDVTAQSGMALQKPEWSTSAAWLDVDNDGYLDLFVANYVQWTPETDVFTTLDGTHKSYATPQVYQGLSNRLFRNLGGGRFEDISSKAGISTGENKALGVVVLDVNGDRLPDLFVSDDTVANKLYVNDGRGGFTEEAMQAGVGYDEMGRARAGMGVDAVAADDGISIIAVGNFSNEAISLYEGNNGGTVFLDAAQRRGLAAGTLSRLTFGTRFADLDNDGRDDLILVNGHIEPEIQQVQNEVNYRQPVDLYLARNDGRFANYAELSGHPLSEPVVGRCLAVGDIDNDRDLDALVSVNGGSPLVLKNDTGGARSVLLDLLDTTGENRQALGATVTLKGKDWSRSKMVRAQSSYLGHSPYTLHFGVPAKALDDLEVQVRWPDGTEEPTNRLKVNGRYQIVRGGYIAALNQD